MDMQNSKENIEDMLELISLNTVEFSDKFVPNISLSSENNSNQNSSNKSELNDIESTPKDLFGVSPIVAIHPRYSFSNISDKIVNTYQKPPNYFLTPPINAIEEASETSGRCSVAEIKLQDYAEKTPYFEINHENNLSWENIGTSVMLKNDNKGNAIPDKLIPNFEDISGIDKLTPVEENSGFSSFDVNLSNSALLKAPEIVLCPVESEDKINSFSEKNLKRKDSEIIEDKTEKNPKILKKPAEIDIEVNIPIQNSNYIQSCVNYNEKNSSLKLKQRASSKEHKAFIFNKPGNENKGNNSFVNLNNVSDVIIQKKNSLKPILNKRKKHLTATPIQNDSFIIHSKPQPRMRFSKSEKKIENGEGGNFTRPADNKKPTVSKSKIFMSTSPKFKDALKKKSRPLEKPNPYSIESNIATFQKVFNVNLKMVPKNEIGKITIKKCLKKRKVTIL